MAEREPELNARPGIIRIAAAAEDAGQVDRIMARNALLGQIHAGNRRLAYDAMAGQTLPAPGVVIEPVFDGDLAGYWLRPADAIAGKAVLYVHGGGYHLGSARSYLGFVSQIAAALRCRVFSIDYPLAPEQPFPAAYDAMLRARDWLTVRPDVSGYAAIGDSAGAGLVLAMLGATPAGHLPASVVALSPWADLTCTSPSLADPQTHDPVFGPELLPGLATSYLAGAAPNDPRASPLCHVPDRGPPLLIQVGTDERLYDDAIRYAHRAASGFANVSLEIYEGMFHVFQRDHGSLATARIAIRRAAEFVTEHWSG